MDTIRQGAGKKIMVAMSGGVDSSVTAALLKQQGYEVHGVYMVLAQPDLDDQIDRVKRIASFLDVPVDLVDLTSDFKETVLKYFSTSYTNGRTPNPCVICNPSIKFGKLLEYASKKGIHLMATGHYVRLQKGPKEQVHLLKGSDPKKDQSYFLCLLTQEQLQRVYFPLGMTEKTKVYEIAAELGLGGMHSKESQDVCFLKNQSVHEFLVNNNLVLPGTGDIVTKDGKSLGQHNGIFRYTIGQRRGLGIPDSTPYYVIGLDPRSNTVIVGKENELLGQRLLVPRINWAAGSPPNLVDEFIVKIRYRHGGTPATVTQDGDGVRVEFASPQRAITPGQFAVLYRGDELIGGGEIE